MKKALLFTALSIASIGIAIKAFQFTEEAILEGMRMDRMGRIMGTGE